LETAGGSLATGLGLQLGLGRGLSVRVCLSCRMFMSGQREQPEQFWIFRAIEPAHWCSARGLEWKLQTNKSLNTATRGDRVLHSGFWILEGAVSKGSAHMAAVHPSPAKFHSSQVPL